jgi:hypothetical protein
MIGARNYSWFYLRCPRTGSQALTEVIMNAWPGDHCGMGAQHSIPRSIETKDSRAWYFPAQRPVTIPEMAYTFVFVREPFSWVRSWWALRMIHGKGHWGEWPQDQVKKQHTNPTLPQYIKWVLDEWPGMCGDTFSLYTQAADFVGTVEHLHTDFSRVCRYLGKPVPLYLPRVGESNFAGNMADTVSVSLHDKFVASEPEAYALWKEAMNG